MPDTLPINAVLLCAAVLASTGGLAWLALAMEEHWQRVRNDRPRLDGVRLLRLLGTISLAVSLALCLAADHPTMAALVWVMSLAFGALVVAGVLAYRPRALRWLTAFLRGA